MSRLSISWDHVRVGIIRGLMALFAFFVLSSVGLAILFFGFDTAGKLLRQPLDDQFERCGQLHTTFCDLSFIQTWGALAWVIWLVPLAALVAAWVRGKATAEKIDQRLFGFVDREFVRALPPPPAATSLPLPWVFPESSQRQQAWDALTALTENIARRDPRFAWGLLVGQPGSGKTRMVLEFAQRLARGRNGAGLNWRQRVTAWCRRALPPLSPRSDDPWHVGVSPTDFNHRIGHWQPMRPTLLLLDDLEPRLAANRLRELAARSRSWRFPVRLLAISQVIPPDVDLVLSGVRNPRWIPTENSVPMPAPPQILAGASRLTAEDVRALLRRLDELGDGLPRKRLYRQEAMEKFLAATRGNPLLVELGLDWVRRGLDPEGISESVLIADRAEGVVKALEAAGIDETQPGSLDALAAATLVAPRARREPIVAAFQASNLPRGAALLGIVPGDQVFDPMEELPAVRPQLIGDAFVRRVLSPAATPRRPEDALKHARKMVAAGIAANPAGLLRASLRNARHDDPLAVALRETPPLAKGDLAGRKQFAVAFVEQGLFVHRDPVQAAEMLDILLETTDPVARSGLADDLYERLQEIVERDTAGRAAARPGVEPETSLPDEDDPDDPVHRFVNAVALALIGMVIIAWRRPDGEDDPGEGGSRKDDVFALLRQVGERDDPHVQRMPLATALAKRLAGHHERGYLFGVGDLLSLRQTGRWHFANLLHEHAVRALKPHSDLSTCSMQAALVVVDAWNGVGVDAGLNDLSQFASQGPSYMAELISAWRYLAWARIDDTAACRQMVERIDAVAGRDAWVDDPGVQVDRADAWRCLCYAFSQQREIESCRKAAARVEEIGRRHIFEDTVAIQTLRLEAWRNLNFALANTGRVNECREALAHVEDIGSRDIFLNEPGIQRERIEAWRGLCFALAEVGDVPGCREALAQVEEIGRRDIFLSNLAIQQERAQAWRNLSFACYKVRDAASCREILPHIEQIAGVAIFLDDWRMQRERIEARRNLALVLSEVGDVRGCRETVDHLEAIGLCKALPDDPEVQKFRAEAWRSLCFALSKSRDSTGCREALDQVEAIASRAIFLDDPHIQKAFIEATRFLCVALSEADDVAGCARLLAGVERIGGRDIFRDNAAIQQERVISWCSFCHAPGNTEAGRTAAVSRIEDIAARFPDHAVIIEELRKARSMQLA